MCEWQKDVLRQRHKFKANRGRLGRPLSFQSRRTRGQGRREAGGVHSLQEPGDGQGGSFQPFPAWCEGPASATEQCPTIPAELTATPGLAVGLPGWEEKERKGREGDGYPAAGPSKDTCIPRPSFNPGKGRVEQKATLSQGGFPASTITFLPADCTWLHILIGMCGRTGKMRL